MNCKKLNCDIGTVTTIFHISDIHIRLLKRHQEYRDVFSKLYDIISEQWIPGSIACITGDVVHSKTDLSPECIRLQSELYRNISAVCPLVIIAGNHDCNLNNLNRLDSIQPVVENINDPNVYYLRDTGLYSIGDVVFSVMSVFDKKENYIKASDFVGETKIALYHGIVSGAKINSKISLSGDIGVDFFDGFDMVLLGDVHLPNQKLTPTIAYPGSLIQQNHGEGLHHGILKWDVKSRSSIFIEVPNDIGYYTIRFNSGILETRQWEHEIPKRCYLRVIASDTSSEVIDSVLRDIGRTSELLSVYVDSKISQKDLKINRTLDDVADVKAQNNLIQEYVSRNLPAAKEVIDDILKLNIKINNGIAKERKIGNLTWIPIEFEFSNLFSYGSGNKIDFFNRDGIVGLFAPNASGKSSLIDALLFTIFDKTSRGSIGTYVLNSRCDSFYCKFKFMLDGEYYIIEREGARSKKNSVKVNVKFYKELDGGEFLNLSAENRDSTNKVIREYVGTYDDFVLTTLSLQRINLEYVLMTQSKRKDVLLRFMGYQIFEELLKVANDRYRELKTLLGLHDRNQYKDKLQMLDEKISTLRKDIKMLKDEKQDIELKNFDLQRKIERCYLEYNKGIKNIDVDDIKNKITNLATQFKSDQEKLKELEKEKEILYRELKSTEEKMLLYVKKRLEERYLEYQNLLDTVKGKKHELEKYQIKLKNIDEKLFKLSKYEYDPNCKYCLTNPFVVDARNSEIEKCKLVDEIDGLNKYILGLTDEIKRNYVNIEDEHVEFVRLKKDLESQKNSLSLLESDLELNRHKLDNLKTQILTLRDDYKNGVENKLLLEQNSKIEVQLKEHESTRDSLTSNLNTIIQRLVTYAEELNVRELEKKNLLGKMAELESLEHEYTIYGYYLKIVNRDGLPYFLITNAIQMFELEINRVLHKMVDFIVQVKMGDNKKNIEIYLKYSEERIWPIELISGMEMFIVSLAIRVALNNLNRLPKTNFFIVDEGFSSLDSDNLNSMVTLFDFMKENFKFVLCISHLDIMRDLVDSLIDIKRIEDYSYVKE